MHRCGQCIDVHEDTRSHPVEGNVCNFYAYETIRPGAFGKGSISPEI